jgi:putative pyruvate formate lyase activating enzyme
MEAPPWPAYLALGAHELRRRAEASLSALVPCELCPRRCGVDRGRGARGVCRTSTFSRVSSAFAHFGEEDCLRGTRGSGTVFFAGCNLGCTFCQNHEISQGREGRQVRAHELADVFMELEAAGCHNINWVSPTHVVPQLLEALALAVERGLGLPIVYNSGGYDDVRALGWLDGVVDIYMPDFKFWSATSSRRYLGAPDYPEVARCAMTEMHRQVGPLEVDDRGLARRGLLVRHLVMPGFTGESAAIFRFLADLSRETYVNVMGQYHPQHLARQLVELNRPVTDRDLRVVLAEFDRAGLRRLDQRHALATLR